MASRRTVITHDRMRNSRPRKENVKKLQQTQQQQAGVLQKLVAQAKAEAKS
jgi:hypothetical protein